MLCGYNILNYNSVCVPVEKQEPPISQSPAKFITLRRRILKREFIDLVGTKLFFNREHIKLIGTKLIPEKQEIQIIALKLLLQTFKIDLIAEPQLKALLAYLELKGKVQYPIRTETEILGSKMIPTCMYHIIKGKRLILCTQYKVIYGQSSIVEITALKGSTLIPCKQYNLIRGEKDITDILKALDMLEEEE